MALKYLFNLACDSVISEFAGELPAGSRMHIRYGEGVLSTDPRKYAASWLARVKAKDANFATALEAADPCARAKLIAKPVGAIDAAALAPELQNLWAGLDGEILRGIDWALVRTDGVVSFDTRLTFNANAEGGKFLIEAQMSGAVDLDPTAPHTFDKARETYIRWKLGQLPNREIRLALGVRFEATGAAPADASLDYQRKARDFPRFMRLTRCQCVAVGKLTLGNSPNRSPIQKLELEVSEHVP